MKTVYGIIFNRPIQAAFVGWAVAQLLKFFINFLINRKADKSRLLGAGGMPSSHSAMACAMMTTIGMHSGFDSTVFALSACFATVVMYDAAGVRRSTGKNAETLNTLIDMLVDNGYDLNDEQKLKELVGHTPLQVLAGAVLGILIGILMS